MLHYYALQVIDENTVVVHRFSTIAQRDVFVAIVPPGVERIAVRYTNRFVRRALALVGQRGVWPVRIPPELSSTATEAPAEGCRGA